MVTNVGIFGRNIEKTYGTPVSPLAITSPWSPQDSLVTFALADALPGLEGAELLMTRDVALQNPALNRAHGVHVTMFAETPFYLMDNAKRAANQPRWLFTSDTSIGPWQRMFGLGSDLFFNGWGCLTFTEDMSDCMHVPTGMWGVLDDRSVWVDPDHIPEAYRARPIAFSAGYGWNGVLVDAARTIRQARKIEDAYDDRLDNPIPLTILGIPKEAWERMTPAERREYREQYVEGRKKGGVALKVAEYPIDMPGQTAVDLYESGRNGARLDIANATSTPADMLEGAKQGGSGGTQMRYQGVGEGGATRSDLWDFGLAKRFMRAFESRMSLDDVCAPGLSIRGDRTDAIATPTPTTSTPSED